MIPNHYFPQAAVGGDLASAAAYWDDPNYVAQVKLDGARYILHKDEKGRVRIYSRQISKKTGQPVDKTLNLIHLAKEFDHLAPKGTVIDGEVVAPGFSSSNLVTKVTGAKPERAHEYQKDHGYLQFRAFDLLAIHGLDHTYLPFRDREVTLRELLHGHAGDIRPLGLHFGTDKRSLYDKVVEEGGEGIILKHLHSPYYEGERHKSWVKVKKQRTFDVVFMGIELAKEETVKKGAEEATRSRIAGKAGAIRYGQYVTEHVVKMKADGLFREADFRKDGIRHLKELGTVSGFDDATRDDITENYRQYIGRVLEVTGQEQFSSGSIRHPRFVRFRNDKEASDCIFRGNEG